MHAVQLPVVEEHEEHLSEQLLQDVTAPPVEYFIAGHATQFPFDK